MNYFLEQSWVQALGWTLLHSIWQASLAATIWAIARYILQNNSAHLRYLAAISTLLVLFACSGITFWKVYPMQTAISSPVPSVESFSLSSLEAATFPNYVKTNEIKNLQWEGLFNGIAPWLSMLWILGASIMGLRFATGIFHLHKLRNQGLQDLELSWQKRAKSLAHKMGLKSNWLIRESSLITEPLTLGHFKPIILIPAGMLSGLSPEQVEAILAHEFAHIYRADFLVNLIQSLIEILFFFHPAVWWLSREIRRERELCCDDLAVATMGDAYVYAEALTQLQLFRHSPKHFLAMQAKGNSGSFTARIHRLFIPQRSRPSAWKSFSAVLLLTLGIMGTGYYAYTQTSKNLLEPKKAPASGQHEGNIEDQHNIVAEYLMSPNISDAEYKAINDQIVRLARKSTRVIRNENGDIKELYILSKQQGKYSKRGIRDFKKLKITLIKKDEKINITLKDEGGSQAFWTDEIQEQILILKAHDKKEKLQKWIDKQKKLGADIDLTSLRVDSITQELERLSVRFKSSGVGSSIPCVLDILYDETGRMISFGLTRLNPYKKIAQAEQSLPVYLDNKFLGYFEGKPDNIFTQLIEFGNIKSTEDLGNANLVALTKHNFYSFFEKENLPLQSTMDVDIIDFNKFRVFILNTREGLAKKFEKEGAKNPEGEKEHILISGKITVPTKDGPLTVPIEGGAISEQKDRSIENQIPNPNTADVNFYLLDGKPLGYKKGVVTNVISRELKSRGINKIDGFIIHKAEMLGKEKVGVVQILSESYAQAYYKRIELQTPILEKIQPATTNPEIWLDGEIISIETVKQIDPSEIVSVDILNGEAAKAHSKNEENKEIIDIRTNSQIQPKLANKTQENTDLIQKTPLDLVVSPNPSSGTFNITFTLEHKMKVHFTVRDLIGKVIYKSSPKVFKEGSQKILWKADKVANGFYSLQLETSKGIVSSQMILKR